MSSDYKDNRTRKNSQLSSFRLAVIGIFTAVKQERNMRIHVIFSILVLLFAFSFSLSKIEWICILFSIGMVISMELLNTAIERVVDLTTSEFHPLAKEAKDIAAGAVFVSAIVSVVVGCIILVPKLVEALYIWI